MEESRYSDLQSVIVTVKLGLDIIFGLYKFITNDSILFVFVSHVTRLILLLKSVFSV